MSAYHSVAITKDDAAILKRLAKAKGISMAGLIRRWIETDRDFATVTDEQTISWCNIDVDGDDYRISFKLGAISLVLSMPDAREFASSLELAGRIAEHTGSPETIAHKYVNVDVWVTREAEGVVIAAGEKRVTLMPVLARKVAREIAAEYNAAVDEIHARKRAA